MPRGVGMALVIGVFLLGGVLAAYSVASYRASSLRASAQALLPQAKYDAAVEALERARSLTPRDASLSRELGKTHLLQYAFRSNHVYANAAVEALQVAVELNPMDSRNANELGWTLMTVGRLPEAESAFAKALELDPYNVHNLYSLGRLYEHQGEPLAAAYLYERALHVREDPEVRARLERIREAL